MMIGHDFALFAATTLFVLLSVQSAAGLKCYRCTSDATNGKFCEDPFDPSKLTESELRTSYVECAQQPANVGKNFVTVCKKIHQLVSGKNVISRSCVWQDEADAPDACMADATASYIQTKFCETCKTDGCNGQIEFKDPTTTAAPASDNGGAPLSSVTACIGLAVTLALVHLI